MGWDWSDTFKGLVSGTLIWVGVSLRKKVIPFVKAIQKFSQLLERNDGYEKRLERVESERQGMYNIVRDPIYVLNEKGEVIYANNAWAKMGGLNDPRDGYGYAYVEMLYDDKEVERLERITERLRDHPSPFEGIVRFKNKQTGALVTTECRTALIFENKKVVGTIGRLYIIEK